jgi:hypothetical protein
MQFRSGIEFSKKGIELGKELFGRELGKEGRSL